MAVVVPNVGEEFFLDTLLAVGYTLRLYTNDVTAGLTPSQIDALTAANFTEATFAGYASSAITGGTWTTTPADPSTGTNTQRTFTRNVTGTAQTVFGYFVTRTTGGALAWFEDFTGPLTVTNNGDAISVTPTITLDDDQDATMTTQGIVARQVLTASNGPHAADTVTDFALSNVPVVAGRTYAIHLHTGVTNSASGTRWDLELRLNGTSIDRFAVLENRTTTTSNVTCDATVYWTAPTTQATDDFAVFANEVTDGASITLFASATEPRTFTILDVGVA